MSQLLQMIIQHISKCNTPDKPNLQYGKRTLLNKLCPCNTLPDLFFIPQMRLA